MTCTTDRNLYRKRWDDLQTYAAACGWRVEREGRKYTAYRVNKQGVGPIDGTTHHFDTITEAFAEIEPSGAIDERAVLYALNRLAEDDPYGEARGAAEAFARLRGAELRITERPGRSFVFHFS